MKYAHFDKLADLVERRIVGRRPHPYLPIDVYNYTVAAQFMPIAEWTEPMKDCRGLILDRDGEIVARPFRKFWNLEQVTNLVPANENFHVWEKVDGSLGIVASYGGETIAATRGSFESEQAVWLQSWLKRKHSHLTPSGETYLVEIVFPANRIVVDYGKTEDAILLAVTSPDGVDLWEQFDACERFHKARRFDALKDFRAVNDDPQFAGQEGFVVQWESGFRAKVKLEEYKRLHRLITQCSTRTIWELLRSGNGVQELLDRVPAEFSQWVEVQTSQLMTRSEERRVGKEC